MLLRYPIVSYFIMSFAIAWSVWIPVGMLVAEPSVAVVLPGAWAPTIAAVLLTAVTEGRSGVRKLLSGLLKWRAGIRWYLFAILGGTAIAFFAIGIHVLLGGSTPAGEKYVRPIYFKFEEYYKMSKKKNHGYHIAQSAVNPNTKYLGKDGIYVSIRNALHFMDFNDALNYAKQKNIKITDAQNVIVPCECDDFNRSKHQTDGEYY